ncbi:MAG: glutamate--tRNA ligase [Caulobacter sp.]|jgi:glutamyl-tRNA synthetase|nr:glutamate--tRNA ligase [Caulobacter sp.]
MSDSKPVVTRIAPSPTGSMHIGTARTALFNYLYAKHCGGQFLLRIEDTDRERSTEAAVQVIFDGLAWLGLPYDGEPVFQHARADRHREVVMSMLEAGKAYRCWLAGDELTAAREKAHAAGHALRSPWRDREPSAADLAKPHAIRFRGPLNGDTVVEDLVQGTVTFRNRDLDDLVLLRTDGAPTYNLAVVVDDHDMGVTHIIRGDDHLNNAARQILIYQALEWDVPAFGHIPLIHGPDGAKLSKRHGAKAVTDFAEMGYLPESMRNYLARLGWSHGDDELFDDAQAIEWFDIADANKGAAQLDWAKLAHVNAHYIRLADDARLLDLVAAEFERRGEPLDVARRAVALRTIPLVKERAKTIVELADQLSFVFRPRPIVLDDKAKGMLTDETKARLGRLRDQLAATNDWSADALHDLLQAFAAAEGVGFGKFGPALRAILTGGSASPDLNRTLASLGREEAMARLNDAL